MSRYANVAENRGEVLTIVETMWWDVCEHYRRCNGGLALGDVTASGNTPDTPPSVVGTHAWLALTGDMLVHNGYSVYGDELELSMWVLLVTVMFTFLPGALVPLQQPPQHSHVLCSWLSMSCQLRGCRVFCVPEVVSTV